MWPNKYVLVTCFLRPIRSTLLNALWEQLVVFFFLRQYVSLSSVVPSQCILARTLSKKQMLMSVVTKVALQLNCKLGGELWALEIPVSEDGKTR